MRAELICRTGPAAGLTVGVRELARIGRGRPNEVDLPAAGVARLHATVSFTGGTYWVEDAGSPAGTFVNGRRVKRERLRHLDVVSLGGTDLVFLLRHGAATVEEKPVQAILSARLLALDGPEPGSARDVPRGTLTVGRATACNLVLDSAAVSKMHARLENTGREILLFDLGSSNGSFVNGVRLPSATLADGDRITFGAVREFRLEIEYGERSMAHAAAPPVAATSESKGRLPAVDLPSNWRLRYDFTPSELQAEKDSPAVPTVPGKKAKTEAAPPKAASAPAATAAPPAVAPAPTLLEVTLVGENATHRLGAGAHVVGRLESCAVPVVTSKVSRHHATLTVSPDGATLADNASANGTYVNGEKIAAPVALSDGDTVTFADVSFRVVLRQG